MKIFYRLCVRNPASGLLQIGCKFKKWQWRHNFLPWRHRYFFWLYLVSLVNLCYWSKIHVSIITVSGITTISFYKVLTKNPEFGNNPVWVFPNIWRLQRVRNTKFDTNVSNKMLECYKMPGLQFLPFLSY